MDLRIVSAELEKCLMNYRLQNIYNASNSSRQYLLKFSVPDSKHAVVVECGNRVHLTEFDIPITQTPSNFVTKLRKHLKTRRLSGIKQIGNDRVLVLQFSDGLFYLVFEFFSAGNIILLDENQKILALNRLVQERTDNDKYAVNETYKMFDKSLFDEKFVHSPVLFTVEQVQGWIDAHKEKVQSNAANSKKNKVYSIHKLLFANSSHLPADLILKNLIDVGINGSSSSFDFDGDKEKLEKIVSGLDSAETEFVGLTADDSQVTGYIVSKKNPNFRPSDDSIKDADSLEFLLDEFHPFKPYKEHAENYKFTPVSGYNKTLDTFFSTIESTKNAIKIEKQKQQAANRLDHARNERDKQIQSLVEQQQANMKKGDTIIYCADLVSSCCTMVQTLVNQQMDWTNIESYIKLEQARGNSTAKAIRLPLNLKENKINLILPDPDAQDAGDSDSDLSESESSSSSESDSDFDSDSDSESDSDNEERNKRVKKPVRKERTKTKNSGVAVWIDLSLSPYANASLYFDTKKNAESKQIKVEKSTNIALKNAEKKINRDLKENLKQESETLKQIRPKFWFEKFYWFVSSDGYLCLAGRDDSQTDMIYFRHFNDNDFYVSADMEGSLKVFIKNPFKGEDIPPSTLMQAGIFAVSSSSAWNSKAIVSAWVVNGTQVSKKDFDDTLIGRGAFNIRGKKEYLPPAQLSMGLGFYLLADSETTSKYKTGREAREKEHGLKIVMDAKKQDLDVEKLKLKEMQNSMEDVSVNDEGTQASAQAAVEGVGESSESTDDTSIILESKTEVKKVRGKKAKMKKIASKYADQDEEEKLLRLDALGTLKQIRQNEQKKEEEKKREIERQQAKYKQSEASERRKKQDTREYFKYLTQETNEDESSVTNYLEILDSFISKSQVNDQFIAAVPVFAPWSSLGKFKYKVKIMPGIGKKGKAVNDAINYFVNRKMDDSSTDTDLDWPRERELIEAIKPNDTMGVFTVNKLKLVLPGGGSADGSKSLKKTSQKKGPKKGKK